MKTLQAEPRYAGRVKTMRPSCVREILSAASDQKMISFAGGLPDPELFPVREIAESTARILKDHGHSALQYSPSEGFRPLREYVAGEVLGRRGIKASPDDVLLTNGAQLALDLVGKVFIEPGDHVLMESPAYLSAIQTFELYQAQLVPIRLSGHGMDPYLLAEGLARYSPKLVYMVPNFQNPTGLTYTGESRCAIAHLLRMHNSVLVEDDPYRDLRFEGEDERPVHRHTDQEAVLMGSFSKVLSPGLRVGWMYARGQTMKHLVVAKQAADLCSSDLTQRVLYDCLMSFDLDRHVETLRVAYRRRRDAMTHWISELFPEGTQYVRPQGGMFIWVTLPKDVSADELLAATLPRGVAFAPGSSFYPGIPELNTLRLNFTHADEASMEKGLRILAQEVIRMLEARRADEPHYAEALW